MFRRRILELLAEGDHMEEIATRLDCSLGTVRSTVYEMRKAAHVRTTTQLVVLFLQHPEQLRLRSQKRKVGRSV